MRFIKLLGLAAVVVALLMTRTGAGQDKKAAGKNHTVEMKDNSFKEKDIVIAVGDTVTWVNKGKNTHTATADDGSFDTKDVKPKDSSKPVPFTKAGKIPYHCVHHKKEMTGTITVK